MSPRAMLHCSYHTGIMVQATMHQLWHCYRALFCQLAFVSLCSQQPAIAYSKSILLPIVIVQLASYFKLTWSCSPECHVVMACLSVTISGKFATEKLAMKGLD